MSEQRAGVFADHLHLIQSAWRGDSLTHPDNHLYPPAPQLADRIWIATFSVDGAVRAARAGHGLMLSRTQPRPAGHPDLTLDEIQNPMVDAYLDALPAGVAPRILASRTAFVADSDDYALPPCRARSAAPGGAVSQGGPRHHRQHAGEPRDYIRQFDAHIGDADAVLASLLADSTLTRATDISFQVHSVEPPHRDTLRSVELIAEHIAPTLRALGTA